MVGKGITREGGREKLSEIHKSFQFNHYPNECRQFVHFDVPKANIDPQGHTGEEFVWVLILGLIIMSTLIWLISSDYRFDSLATLPDDFIPFYGPKSLLLWFLSAVERQ